MNRQDSDAATLHEFTGSEAWSVMRRALKQKIAACERICVTTSDENDSVMARKIREAQTQCALYRKMLDKPEEFWLPREE